MMALPPAAGQRVAYGEDAEAVVRAIFGLTAGVGALAAAATVAIGQLPFTAPPTLVLLICLLFGSSLMVAGSGAASVWLVLLPAAPGEALLVPLTMIVFCLTIGIGPERLLAWLARDATPTVGGVVSGEGWIEEDVRCMDPSFGLRPSANVDRDRPNVHD